MAAGAGRGSSISCCWLGAARSGLLAVSGDSPVGEELKSAYLGYNLFLPVLGGMAVNIKNQRVEELLSQLRQITGQGSTEIVREALEVALQRQRQLRRQQRLQAELETLQQQASAVAEPFAAESLYDEQGLPV